MAKKPYGDINRNRTLPNNSSKKNQYAKKNYQKDKYKNFDNTTRIKIEKEKEKEFNLDHSFLEGRSKEKGNRSRKEKEKILMEKESKFKQLVLLKSLFFTMSFFCIALLLVLVVWNHFNQKPEKEEVVEEEVVEEKVELDSNYLFIGDFHTVHMNFEDLSMSYPFVVKGEETLTTDSLYHNLNQSVYIYNPSVIFMEVGLEDLGNDERVEDIVSRYKIIIKEIQENRPNAHIYVESIYPIFSEKISDSNKYKAINNATIKKTNQELKTMSSDLKVKYVDLYSALLEKNHLKKDYTEDGVSLNADGYKKIWSVLRDIVEEEK